MSNNNITKKSKLDFYVALIISNLLILALSFLLINISCAFSKKVHAQTNLNNFDQFFDSQLQKSSYNNYNQNLNFYNKNQIKPSSLAYTLPAGFYGSLSLLLKNPLISAVALTASTSLYFYLNHLNKSIFFITTNSKTATNAKAQINDKNTATTPVEPEKFILLDFDEDTQPSKKLKSTPSNKLKISPIISKNIELINKLNNSQITEILKRIKKPGTNGKYLFDPQVFRSKGLLKINKKFIINFLLDPKYVKNSLFIEIFVSLVLRIKTVSITDLASINGINALDVVKIKDTMKNDFYKKAVDHIKNAKLLTKKAQKTDKQQTIDQSSVNKLTTEADTPLQAEYRLDELQKLFYSLDNTTIFFALSENDDITEKIKITDHTVLKFREFVELHILHNPKYLHIFLDKFFHINEKSYEDLAEIYEDSTPHRIRNIYSFLLEKFIKSYRISHKQHQHHNLYLYNHDELQKLFNSLDNAMILYALSKNEVIKEMIKITDRTVLKFKHFMNDNITNNKNYLHLFLVKIFNLTGYNIIDLARSQKSTQESINSTFRVLINQFVNDYYINTKINDDSLNSAHLKNNLASLEDLSKNYNDLSDSIRLQLFKDSRIFVTSQLSPKASQAVTIELVDKFILEKITGNELTHYLFLANILKMSPANFAQLAKHLNQSRLYLHTKAHSIRKEFFEFYEFYQRNHTYPSPQKYPLDVVTSNLASIDELRSSFYSLTDYQRLELFKNSRLFKEHHAPDDLSIELMDEFILKELTRNTYEYFFLAYILQLSNASINSIAKHLHLKISYLYSANNNIKKLFFEFYFNKTAHNVTYQDLLQKNSNKTLPTLDELKNLFYNMTDNERLELFVNSKFFRKRPVPEGLSIELVDAYIDKHIISNDDRLYIFLADSLKMVNASQKNIANHLQKSVQNVKSITNKIKERFFKFYKSQ